MFPGDIVTVKYLSGEYKDDDDFVGYEGKTGIIMSNPNPKEIELKEDEWIVSFVDENNKEKLAVFKRNELFLLQSAAADAWDKSEQSGFFKWVRRKFGM